MIKYRLLFSSNVFLVLIRRHIGYTMRKICHIPKWAFNVVTRRMEGCSRHSVVLAMLCSALILSFISTVAFWAVVSNKHIEWPVHIGIEKRASDGIRTGDFLNTRQTLITTKSQMTDPKLLLPPAPCSNTTVPVVCPELDIPDLVGERKINMSDVSIEEVENLLLGNRLKAVKRLVEKANHLLNSTVVRVNSAFVPCAKTTSRDKCGNKYIQEILEHTRLQTTNYIYIPGGVWKPTDCVPRWKVAIVIPYRNRSFHLPILLRYLTPMLQRQKLEFGFYIVEQANNINFNRAMLMNIGFLESLNFSKWDCFIFHDVDHIPLSDFNYYGCSGMPRHFLSGADRWKYKLPYETFFGAVSGLTRDQMHQINGLPNVYWGWGGEDDEIWKRIKEAGLEISRVKGKKGYYNVIKHHHHSASKMEGRFKLLQNFKRRWKKDGLNNLEYKKPVITLNTLYTNISVDIMEVKLDVVHPES